MGDSDDAQSDRCENPVNSKGCPAQARTHFVPQLGHMSSTTVPFSERRSGSSGTWELLHAVPVPAGATSTTLAAVSCTASNACTAVGSYLNAASENHTLAERWNGTEWAIQTGATVEGSPTLSGVSCTSATACVAVGLHNHFPSGQTTVAETWNGTKWSVQEVEVDLRSPAGGGPTVSCTSSTACTIVGDFTVSGKQHTGVERWNGTKWSSQEPVNPQENNEFYGVSCSSATECTAVGSATSNTGSQTLVERWNGTTWSVQTTPGGSNEQFNALLGVSCLSSTACTAAGYAHGEGLAFPFGGVPSADGWNGVEWTGETILNPTEAKHAAMPSISCTASAVCTAVGGYTTSTSVLGPYNTLAERYE